MNFKENNAIYLQIADRICDEIILGIYKDNERLPSVREYAALVEVNANTAMRSFDYLQSQEIIFNKRGIGYFVSPGAKDMILALRRETFLKEDLKDVFRQIYTLGINIEDIMEMYRKYSNERKNENHENNH